MDSDGLEKPEEPARKDVLHVDSDSIAAYKKGAELARAARPEPRVVVLPDFCVNPLGGSCQRCVLACPAGAILLEEGGLPVVDAQACTMCGICQGVCDAFSSNDVTMTDLASRIRRAAQRGEGVFVTCPRNVNQMPEGTEPEACVVSVPCLAALSPEFWVLLLAEGIDLKVACDLALCVDCPTGGSMAEMLYTHAIETAQSWSAREIGLVDEAPQKTGYFDSFVIGDEVDRRGLFTHFAGNVEDAASGAYRRRNSTVLQEFYEQRERMRAQTRQMENPLPEVNRFDARGMTRKLLAPKRKMLLDALAADGSIAERVPVVVSETDCATCCNALSCVKACPTGARCANAHNGFLAYDARLCIGCGLCATVCGQGAVSMTTQAATVFSAYAEGPLTVCPEKVVEWEQARERMLEEQRPQLERIAEAD